jgi:NAD+ kinase
VGSSGSTASIPWKTIGIAVKAGSAGTAPLVRRVAETAAAHATDLVLEPEAARWVPGSSACPLEQVAAQADLMIVLGGDGTVLSAARAIGERDVPILGINLGRLGLMADVNATEVDAALAAVFAGDYLIESRARLAVTRIGASDAPRRPALVLNDVVVTGALDLARLIDLETRVNQTPMSEFRADGLIVATPTGSTAYNLGAGGPILDPALPALIVTPICPQGAHQQRPIVLSDACVVEVRIDAKQTGNVTLDGQVGFRLGPAEGIRVTRSHHPSRFLRLRGYDYFATLRSKLQWGSQ